jgi:hypothetical protein
MTEKILFRGNTNKKKEDYILPISLACIDNDIRLPNKKSFNQNLKNMKSIFLFITVLLFLSNSIFSQTAMQKKQTEQKKTTTKTPTAVINQVVKKDTLAKASTKTQPKTAVANPVIQQKTTTKESTLPIRKTLQNNSNQNITIKVDSAKATLLNAFFTLETGISAITFPVGSYDNKDADTHWSCGIFDQNDKPVASFHDDSNTDEYEEGSITGPLKMHIDNPATLGDFSNDGHLHINIAPNGNDTWHITDFKLELNFLNPNLKKTVKWGSITLSQDKRDIDLYFYYDGKNLVGR